MPHVTGSFFEKDRIPYSKLDFGPFTPRRDRTIDSITLRNKPHQAPVLLQQICPRVLDSSTVGHVQTRTRLAELATGFNSLGKIDQTPRLDWTLDVERWMLDVQFFHALVFA